MICILLFQLDGWAYNVTFTQKRGFVGLSYHAMFNLLGV